jgi:hypothetical protein
VIGLVDDSSIEKNADFGADDQFTISNEDSKVSNPPPVSCSFDFPVFAQTDFEIRAGSVYDRFEILRLNGLSV